jgi:hypothetical protein
VESEVGPMVRLPSRARCVMRKYEAASHLKSGLAQTKQKRRKKKEKYAVQCIGASCLNISSGDIVHSGRLLVVFVHL